MAAVDSSDEELGVPAQPAQPADGAASSASIPIATNPFPLVSPAGSPAHVDPNRALLEQLAATTQLLSSIVQSQQSNQVQQQQQQQQQQQVRVANPVGQSSSSGFSDANKVLNRPDVFGSASHEADLSGWQDWSHSLRIGCHSQMLTTKIFLK